MEFRELLIWLVTKNWTLGERDTCTQGLTNMPPRKSEAQNESCFEPFSSDSFNP